jgi:mRNA interferase RelE/StbE
LEIRYASDAAKVLRRLPRNLASRILDAVGRLPAGDVKRLKGRTDYRLRVGDWRVIFAMDGGTIMVKAIASRGDIYKR